MIRKFATVALAVSCSADKGPRTVTVFAAPGKTFGHNGVQVRSDFGGSSAPAQQVTRGAPADVFAAASPATVKQVTDAGLATAPRTRAGVERP